LGTPASSTTKTGHHDVAEILLKVALKHQKINQSISFHFCFAWHKEHSTFLTIMMSFKDKTKSITHVQLKIVFN
jgi:hypothetical protein